MRIRRLFRKLRQKEKLVNSGFDDQVGLHFVQDVGGDERVYVSDRRRLKLYERGLAHRRNWLLSDYRLPEDLVRSGDIVIDVGANIGELGGWVESKGARYIAFEPDPNAHKALKMNVRSDDLFQTALSEKTGTAEFYLNTAEADSSLFQPNTSSEVIKVEVATLDGFFQDYGIPDTIRLMKIEAEGMEPEILRGGAKILQNVEFLAVDAGPERGGENTVPGVFKAIQGMGFEVIDCYLQRGTFLFAKQ